MSPFFNAVEHHRERSTSRPPSANTLHHVASDSHGPDALGMSSTLSPKLLATNADAKEYKSGSRSISTSEKYEIRDTCNTHAHCQDIGRLKLDDTLVGEPLFADDSEKGRLNRPAEHGLIEQLSGHDSARGTSMKSSYCGVDANVTDHRLVSSAGAIANDEVPTLVPINVTVA
nr:hypothetical protein CFP56_79076 [Quercus suber]